MSLTLFILPQLLIKFIFKETVWDKRVRLLLYAAVLPMFWFLSIPQELQKIREMNFIQHALGGVSVGLISLYFISIFSEKLGVAGSPMIVFKKFWFQALFVFVCVSAFGVANELLEFLLDWAGIGIFSADRYDVWFDLTANTLGAFVVFLAYRLGKAVLH